MIRKSYMAEWTEAGRWHCTAVILTLISIWLFIYIKPKFSFAIHLQTSYFGKKQQQYKTKKTPSVCYPGEPQTSQNIYY